MSDYLFGYGSMMNLRSAGRALKREVGAAELIPAYLRSYTRTWSLKERVFAESLGREITAVFLDLDREPGASCNGVLIEITPRALEHLQRREKNYDAVDVTAGVESPADGTLPLDSRVYTFVSKPEFKVRDGEAGLFVMDRYVRMIDEACAQLGPRFAREYIASTAHVTYPRINGPYTFVDEEQAKHV